MVKYFMIFDTNNLSFINFIEFYIVSIRYLYLLSTWDVFYNPTIVFWLQTQT